MLGSRLNQVCRFQMLFERIGFVGSVGCTLLNSTPTVLAKPAQLALPPSVRGPRLESIVVPSVIIGLIELMQQQRWFCIVD